MVRILAVKLYNCKVYGLETKLKQKIDVHNRNLFVRLRQKRGRAMPYDLDHYSQEVSVSCKVDVVETKLKK